jgi:hypothetical protein
MQNSESAGQNWGPYRKAWWTFAILAYVNLLISPFTTSWAFVASFGVILTFPCPACRKPFHWRAWKLALHNHECPKLWTAQGSKDCVQPSITPGAKERTL